MTEIVEIVEALKTINSVHKDLLYEHNTRPGNGGEFRKELKNALMALEVARVPLQKAISILQNQASP